MFAMTVSGCIIHRLFSVVEMCFISGQISKLYIVAESNNNKPNFTVIIDPRLKCDTTNFKAKVI